MKLKLKQDITIPAGTIMDSDGVATKTERDPAAFVRYSLAFGPNSTGELLVGHEVGDDAFDEWFEAVE